MVEKFEKLLILYPHLRPFLLKICRRCRNKGVLIGGMKLGQNLDSEDLEALHAVFGMQALNISKSGEVRISFNKFFKGMAFVVVEEWIDALHHCLDLPRLDAAREVSLNRERFELILERLRIAYPELDAVHQSLKIEKGSTRFLEVGGIDIQAHFFKAAEITRFLKENSDIVTFSDLGARFCNDSKALRDTELGRLVESWLSIMENADGLGLDAGQTIWDRYHVFRDRLSVQATVFGPLVYEKNNQSYDWIYKLWQAGESATLSWGNIVDIDRMVVVENVCSGAGLITCENEAPCGRMIRERRTGILLYTSGFPNDAVMSLYRFIAPLVSSCRHWGDSDLAGLQIAAMLNDAHPLKLWRCNFADLDKHRNRLIALSEEQKCRIDNYLAKWPDFVFANELRFTLEHGWLEQESWLSPT